MSLIWQPTSKGIIFDRLQANKTPKQVVNHFEFHKEISTKIGLVKNLQLYCELNKISLFDLTPVTFIIDLDDKYVEYDIQEFVKFFQASNMQMQSQQTQNKSLNTHGNSSSKYNNSISCIQDVSSLGHMNKNLTNNNKLISNTNLSYRPNYSFLVRKCIIPL